MVKSPRVLRPHTIDVINRLGEDESGEEQTATTTVKFVKCEFSKTSSLGSTGSTTNSSLLIVMDLNDYKSDKTYSDTLEDSDLQFTFKLGDRVVYDDNEYEISSVQKIDPVKYGPRFIEVRCS